MSDRNGSLKITNARLPERSGLWEIAISQGVIKKVAESIPDRAPAILDAQGQLLIPGLVDAHMHLDKVFLLDRCQRIEGTFDEALRETLQAKRAFTVEDIQIRARRAIEQAISFGTTLMRSHVEVDPSVGLTAIHSLLPLKAQYCWGLTLQLAIFAQEGITNQPGTEALLRQAMALGGDAIGSAPYVDPDPEQNIRTIFDLAQEFDCDVDFHLDFLDDSKSLLLPFVIAETNRRGWQGRVCLGHMTKLAGLPPAELAAIAPAIRDAGISILALPASDLYMMSRKDTHNVRRGVAPVHTLAQLGINSGLATNNVQNLFTPFGDGDVLKICTLLSQILHLGTIAHHEQCLGMATTQAAKAIGIHNYGIKPGNMADLVLLNATSVTEAIGAAPCDRTVIKSGRVVAQSQLKRQLFSTNAL
ncbi:amidohydrolase family protein [Kovacikia minuta CCNUW1]|uniref:amidohydrolase family protein n=1 Tax=Kovacikia minuta TaxID=2931930 RepID=UPI001CCB27D6|nr:amidohydrolase family protein [Kovacikia minuta]UBF26668.1 amidohydrolase family protein [Kovacikia minuta CCNUW1]